MTYKDAGVDIRANARWVAAIEGAMRSTYGPRVYKHRHGGFAGLFRLDFDEQLFRRNYRQPVIVGCTDGVGTKLLLAIEMNRLSTIGIDLVAMNVNDLLTCGAEPLFFLDYLAVHKLDPSHLRDVIEGMAAGCREAGCALLGGETAEMPDLYASGAFDLAGFAVGVVEHDRVIDGSRVSPGDHLIALPSSGVHSNGYSLIRKLIAKNRCRLDKVYDELGETLGDALLRPTRIYVDAVQAVLKAYPVKRVVTAMAHITGGGLRENIGRVLPPDCDAVITRSALQIAPARRAAGLTLRGPAVRCSAGTVSEGQRGLTLDTSRKGQAPAARLPVFEFIRRLGTTRAEMLKVFNMGIGFVFIVRPYYAAGVLHVLQRAGERPAKLGRIQRGRQLVRFR